MRVLFDVIYSAMPRRCSSAYKFKLIAEMLLAEHPDCYIYWRWPTWAKEEDEAWLPQSDRLIRLPCEHTRANRVLEYAYVRDDLAAQIWSHGEHWDTDVIVTMRAPQIMNMLLQTLSVRMSQKRLPRSIVCLEEMAMLSSRATVAAMKTDYQDLQTLGGYLHADLTLITAGHVRDQAVNIARRLLPPSSVRALADKVKLVCPANLPEHYTKAKKDFPEGHPRILFSGRMNASSSNLEAVFKAVTTAWVLSGEDTPDFVVSSVSEKASVPIPQFADTQKNNRDQFHALLKEQVHVGIYMAVDAEFSLTVIEPLCLGVPMIIARQDWSEALLGKDYPFFVSGEVQALGWIKEFTENYEQQYAAFIEWRDGPFAARFAKGGVYGTHLLDEMRAYFDKVAVRHEAYAPKDTDYSTVLATQIVKGEPFDLFDLAKKAEKAGLVKLALERSKWFNDEIPEGFKVEACAIRMELKKLTGARDYGPKPGWMVVDG